MPNFRTEDDEHRKRQRPDVVAVQAGRREVRIHQFQGSGIELGVWRQHAGHEWVRYREPVKLKRWETVALIRALLDVMKDRETRNVRDDELDEVG